MAIRQHGQGFQIAGHAHLVNRDDRAGARSHRIRQSAGVYVVGLRIDVYENGNGALISDRIGRCNERMTGRDDLVTWSDVEGRQSELQGRRAIGHGARKRRPDESGEFTLEGGHLRSLRNPAGEDGRSRRVGLFLGKDRHCDRDHDAAAWP